MPQPCDDLRTANAKVAAAVKELDQVRTLLPGARADLRDAEQKSAASADADRAAQAELEQATAAAVRAEQELAEVEFQITDLQSRVGNLAREVYQNGAFADFDLLVTAGSPAELSDRVAAIDAVSRVNNQTLTHMGEIRAELALKEARIARDRAAAAKAKVDSLIAQKATALDVAATERARVLKQYKSMQAEQQRIAARLAKRAAKEAARLARGGELSHTPTTVSGFSWPVPGASAGQRVGPRTHLVYGYRSCHTGAEIGASSGTPIRATAAGVVVSTSSGGPYGNNPLISHGDGLFSMYAHQSRFGVQEGQTVNIGEVIGYVGSTDWVTGPLLHFEMHVGNQPYNPMGWFGGGKGPV